MTRFVDSSTPVPSKIAIRIKYRFAVDPDIAGFTARHLHAITKIAERFVFEEIGDVTAPILIFMRVIHPVKLPARPTKNSLRRIPTAVA